MRRRLLIGGAVLACAGFAAMLTGCGAVSEILEGSGAERDVQTGEVTAAGQADVFDLEVGDCFNDTALESVSDVPAVPCDEEHDNEIYHLFDLEGGDYPGEETVSASADEGCRATFEAFVGLAYEESELDFGTLYPSEDTWADLGDREVVCLAYDPAGMVVGSLAGVAR